MRSFGILQSLIPPSLAPALFLQTIVAAVRQGRGVFDNLRKILTFILPTAVAQGLGITAAMILGVQEPLTIIVSGMTVSGPPHFPPRMIAREWYSPHTYSTIVPRHG